MVLPYLTDPLISGIGPRAHLEEHGLKVVRDMPGVGNFLVSNEESYFKHSNRKDRQQDHFSVPLGYFIPMSHSLLRIESTLGFLKEFLKYLITGKGLILGPVPEVLLFAKSDLLNDNTSKSNAFPRQSDSSNPDNLPDIEIMPVSPL